MDLDEEEDEEEDLEHLAPAVSHEQNMKYLNSFSKQKLSNYDSKKKGIIAKKCLIHVEKILEALDIPDNRQMAWLVAYSFICDAENWWKNVKQSRTITRIH